MWKQYEISAFRTDVASPFKRPKRYPAMMIPIRRLQKIATSAGEGGAQYDFSPTGRLVYGGQEAQAAAYPIQWVDRDGRTAPLLEEPGLYANPRISPDTTRLALTVLRDDNWDVWVYDLGRGVSTRLTFDEGIESDLVANRVHSGRAFQK